MSEQLTLPRQLAYELTLIDDACDEWVESFKAELDAVGVKGVVVNRHTGEQKRWTSIHELVIETHDGRLWRRLYEVGLTESQDEQPFEYEGPVIPFDLCKKVGRLEWDYVPVARLGA